MCYESTITLKISSRDFLIRHHHTIEWLEEVDGAGFNLICNVHNIYQMDFPRPVSSVLHSRKIESICKISLCASFKIRRSTAGKICIYVDVFFLNQIFQFHDVKPLGIYITWLSIDSYHSEGWEDLHITTIIIIIITYTDMSLFTNAWWTLLIVLGSPVSAVPGAPCYWPLLPLRPHHEDWRLDPAASSSVLQPCDTSLLPAPTLPEIFFLKPRHWRRLP